MEYNTLLAACCAVPEDDAPALAFADWLQENPERIEDAVLALLRDGPGRKVFLCSSGGYSDYGVDAVFLIRAEAEEFDRLRAQTAYADVNDIREMSVGRPSDEEELRDRWTSRIDIVTGNIEHDDPDRVMTAAGAAAANHPAARAAEWVTGRGGGTPRQARICSHESQEHADKLAVEWRQEFLRLVGGVDRLVIRGSGDVVGVRR